jgi:hypothetical protein
MSGRVGTGDPRENEDGPVIRRARFGDLRSNPRTERRDRTTAPSISNRGHSPRSGSAVGRDREALPLLLTLSGKRHRYIEVFRARDPR